MPLPNLTVLEWVGVATASWLVLAIATTSAVCFAANRLKRIRARLCGTVQPDPWLPPDRDYDTVEMLPIPPVPPSQRRLPESPLDLEGFALDARFYAVLAPSFREYH